MSTNTASLLLEEELKTSSITFVGDSVTVHKTVEMNF